MTQSPFLKSIKDFMMVRNYSLRTIDSYIYWIKYFIVFNGKQHPSQLGDVEIERFLTHLAVNRQSCKIYTSNSTQCHCFSENKVSE